MVIKHILTGMILQVPMILIKYTLVFPNIAIGNGPLEDVFPTFFMGIFHCHVRNQLVQVRRVVFFFRRGHPGRWTAGNLKNHPTWNPEKSAEAKHHDFRFHPFIFQGVDFEDPENWQWTSPTSKMCQPFWIWTIQQIVGREAAVAPIAVGTSATFGWRSSFLQASFIFLPRLSGHALLLLLLLLTPGRDLKMIRDPASFMR